MLSTFRYVILFAFHKSPVLNDMCDWTAEDIWLYCPRLEATERMMKVDEARLLGEPAARPGIPEDYGTILEIL